MRVTTKKLDGGKMHFDAVATVEEVSNALQQASVMFAQQMGLQPEANKTVAQVAEEKMGVKDLDSIVANQAAELLVPFAIDRKNIVPAYPARPQPKTQLRRGQEFSFSIDILVKPDYELSSYEPVAVTLPKFVAPNNDELVDQQIAQLAKGYTEYVTDPDSTVVEKGSSCKIAIEAKENGEVVPGLSTEGRTYVAGEGYMPEEFDKNVLGMKTGETKSFSFSGPDVDENGEQTDAYIDCTVTVLEMQKAVVPEVNDEWVQKYMPFYKSLEDMRNAISSSFSRQSEEEYEAYKRQACASQLAQRFQGSIADEVYEAMREQLMSNLRNQLAQEGKAYDQFVQEQGGEQQFGMMMMLQTREMLVQGYALDALFRHEHMKLEDADIDETCRSMNPQANPRQLRQQIEQGGHGFALRESAQRLKASKWLVEHADITYSEQSF